MLFEMVTLFNSVQARNAKKPMLVTLPGILMLVKLSQFLNAELLILVSWLFDPNVTLVKP